MNSKQVLYFFIILFTVVIAACSSTEKVMGPEENVVDLDPITEDKSAKELQKMLVSTRNSLSDVYHTQSHDMPKVFLMTDTTRQAEQDPFDGFRIQIVSTRNVDLADSVSNQFSMWADTTITGYTPEAYVSFKQPFYKVHVGDFQDRSKADELSKLIKKKYSDAWVVHDRIDPEKVPADTTQISLAENNEQ